MHDFLVYARALMREKSSGIWRVFFIGMAIAALLILSVREYRFLPDGRMHLSFFDVGQGDSEFIVTPNPNEDGCSPTSFLISVHGTRTVVTVPSAVRNPDTSNFG